MSKIVIVPLQNQTELNMFEQTVLNGVSIEDLRPNLFTKLFDSLELIHGQGEFPVWGVPRGSKSVEANKWNKVEENDVALFVKQGVFVGFAKVRAKFQSENIARELWQNLPDEEPRQYLFTLEKLFQIDSELNKALGLVQRKYKVEVENFQVMDLQHSLEFLKLLSSLIKSNFSQAQGFGLNSAEKNVVEKHAVQTAIKYLLNSGYLEVKDVGDTQSFDLLAIGPSGQLCVEVKGSTGPNQSVVLTRNEVQFQLDAYPNNALFVLSEIELNRVEPITAQGGKIEFISPWKIDKSKLNPISYDYKF